jgi:hypothetical protein
MCADTDLTRYGSGISYCKGHTQLTLEASDSRIQIFTQSSTEPKEKTNTRIGLDLLGIMLKPWRNNYRRR